MSEPPAKLTSDTGPIVVAHVVTFNHESTISKCIEALCSQTGYNVGENLFVYITDNASTDSTTAAIQNNLGKGVILQIEDKNLGFTGANNKGPSLLETHNADYLLLVNPDLALAADGVSELVGCLEFDSAAGSATPKLLRAGLDLAPLSPPIIDGAGMEFVAQCRHYDRGAGQLDVGQFDRQEYVVGGSGACLLIRKSCIDDVSFINEITGEKELFEPNFFAYREDAELAWRMQRFGWLCRYHPSARAYHVRNVTPQRRKALPKAINRLGVQNRILLQLLHYDWRYLRLHIPTTFRNLLVLGACLTIERESLPGVFTGLSLARAMQKKRRWLQAKERVDASILSRWFRSAYNSEVAISTNSKCLNDSPLPSLDILVINYNSGQRLRKCLQHLSAASQTLESDIKLTITIVDNASADGSASRLQALFETQPQIRFILSKENLGFAGGIQKGVASINGDTLMLLNPDIEISATQISELIRSLAQYQDVAAVAPILVNGDGSAQTNFCAKLLPQLPSVIAELLLLHRIWPNNPWSKSSQIETHPVVKNYLSNSNSHPTSNSPRYPRNVPLPIQQPPAACFIVRREVFNELNGFDTDFWPAWFEDVDFCKRLHLKGYCSALLASARVYHEGGYSVESLDKIEFKRIWYSNLAKYWSKHSSSTEYLLIRCALPIGIMLRALVLLLKGNTRKEGKQLARLALGLGAK